MSLVWSFDRCIEVEESQGNSQPSSCGGLRRQCDSSGSGGNKDKRREKCIASTKSCRYDALAQS